MVVIRTIVHCFTVSFSERKLRENHKESTFLEIHFTKLTKLAKLTNIHPNVFYIKIH